jgi:hypothetical protein
MLGPGRWTRGRRAAAASAPGRSARLNLPAEMTVSSLSGELQGTGIIGDVSRRGNVRADDAHPRRGTSSAAHRQPSGRRKLVLRA